MDYWYLGGGTAAAGVGETVSEDNSGPLTGSLRAGGISGTQSKPGGDEGVATGEGVSPHSPLNGMTCLSRDGHLSAQLAPPPPPTTGPPTDLKTPSPHPHTRPLGSMPSERGKKRADPHSAVDENILGYPKERVFPLYDHDYMGDLMDSLELGDGPLASSTPIREASQDPNSIDLCDPIWHPQDRAGDWPAPRAIGDSYPHLSHIYNTVRRQGLPNALAARMPVPSGLHLCNWQAIATGHPHDMVVLDGITFGFSLQYEGPAIPSSKGIENHQSARAYPAQVKNYIQTELQAGAMIGPFNQPPFEWTHLSPLMTRPKSSENEGDRRVIVDLSFPQDANVNMAIPANTIYGVKYPHRLPTVDDFTEIIRRDCFAGYMYSVDISRAYRNFPTDPLDWPLTGICHEGHALIDLAMPFGARSSSLHMQLAAQYILRHLRTKDLQVLVYLDDIVGYASTLTEATAHYHRVKDVMAALGLPLAERKLTPPTRVITWLGITVDADHRTISIPQQKVTQTLKDMCDMYNKHSLCRKDVQCLAGRINHLAKACKPARLFMARILAYLRGHPPGHTPISEGVRADLRWFMDFLPRFNGVSLISPPHPAFHIEADSCLKGGGALGDGKCYMYEYPPALAAAHISQLEAINCMAAVRALITPAHRGLTVLVECDNSAAVAVFGSGRGRDPVILASARAIWRHAAEIDCALTFRHVPGEFMDAADALSRAPLSASHAARARSVVVERGLRLVEVDFSHFDFVPFL